MARVGTHARTHTHLHQGAALSIAQPCVSDFNKKQIWPRQGASALAALVAPIGANRPRYESRGSRRVATTAVVDVAVE